MPPAPLTLRSKIRCTRSAGTPLPSSFTSITTERGVCEVLIVTVPSPWLSALSSRVATTCETPPTLTYARRPCSPVTSSFLSTALNAGSHSLSCWEMMSSMLDSCGAPEEERRAEKLADHLCQPVGLGERCRALLPDHLGVIGGRDHLL